MVAVAVPGDMTVTGSPPGIYQIEPHTLVEPEVVAMDLRLPTSEDSGDSNPPWAGQVFSVKVRDTTGYGDQEGTPTYSFVYPSIEKIGAFLLDVAVRSGVAADLFDVVYQTRGEDFNLTTMPQDGHFDFLNIPPNEERTFSMNMVRKRAIKHKSVVRNLDEELEAASLSGTAGNTIYNLPSASSSEPMSIEAGNSDNFDTVEFVGREFVGLKNQQMTCYLNSLLQSLFFCPEFRNMIYSQVIEYDPARKSIFGALQKLFLQLQFSVRSAIETDEITKTFGWKSDENAVQHDIEELYRLIMGSMGDEFKSSGQLNQSDSLYGGILNDCVECLNCHNRNPKKELFLALSLPVRAFGKSLPEPTILEAIRAFVQFELLNGENQYKCSNCLSLQDARKGLRIQKLPYFLCLHLKRSEFDFQTMARKKVNDRVEFPFILDMNEFIDSPNESDDGDSSIVPPIDPCVIGSSRMNMLESRTSHSRPAATEFLDSDDGDSDGTSTRRPIRKNRHEDAIESAFRNGPNVYQLLSVLIHRGSSSHGGHYYTYVYDLEKNQWYCCNDQNVRRISESQIYETFGGRGGRDDDREGQAYMLIYRRVDPLLNSLPMTLDEMPPHMKELWTNVESTDMQNYAYENYEKSVLRIDVCVRQVETWTLHSISIAICKNDTMEVAAYKCFKEFFPTKEVDLGFVRLVRFNVDYNVGEESWPGCEKKTFGDVYRRPRNLDMKEQLMLELREPDQEFDAYTSRDVMMKATLSNYADQLMVRHIEVHVPFTTTVGMLKEKLARAFHIPLKDLVVNARIQSRYTILRDDTRTLNYYQVHRYCELVVENVAADEIEIFKNFVEDWNDSYYFEIECQIPLGTFVESKPENNNDVTLVAMDHNMEEIFSDSEPSIQFNFDPTEGMPSEMVGEVEISVAVPPDCSDHSTSEESSLTGSERTIVGPGSPVASQTEGIVSCADELIAEPGSILNYQTVPVVGEIIEIVEAPTKFLRMDGNSTPDRGHFFRVTGQTNVDEYWMRYCVRADTRMPLCVLSNHIQILLGVEESKFVLYRVDKDVEFEVVDEYQTRLENLEHFDIFRVRYQHRLKRNEARFPVYFFNPSGIGFPKYLTDVVLSSDMAADKMLAHCIEEIRKVSALVFDPFCVRIRRKKVLNPAKVLRSHNTVSDLFSSMRGEIYFQILDVPQSLLSYQYVLTVRRYFPSTLTLGMPFEFVFAYDYNNTMEEMLGEQLSQFTGIENLEYAVPEGEFPYDMHPVAILEKLDWRNFYQAYMKRCITIYNDEGAIFIRDSTEKPGPISAEARRAYDAEVAAVYNFPSPPRRAEVGLTINLARSPPS